LVQINWTYQSRTDLEDIADYISKDSVKYARFQIFKIVSRTRFLKKLPYSGKKLVELDRDDLRELIEGNYRIIYKIVTSSRIDILTIHHSSRDLKRRYLE